MRKFHIEDQYTEGNFHLRLIPTRNFRLSYSDKCSLCLGLDLEPTIKLSNGYLLETKYPAIENSILYVTNNCQELPTVDNFYDIFKVLEQKPTSIFFCNMLAEPSIENHWHVDLVNSFYLPQGFVNYWFRKNITFKDRTTNKISLITSRYGIYYSLKFNEFELEAKAKIAQQLYRNLFNQNNNIHIAITRTTAIINSFSGLNENISVSAKSIFGYFTTGNRKKFEYMKWFGPNNILYRYSKLLNL